MLYASFVQSFVQDLYILLYQQAVFTFLCRYINGRSTLMLLASTSYKFQNVMCCVNYSREKIFINDKDFSLIFFLCMLLFRTRWLIDT